MSLRRPRIKAAALLVTKRKPRDNKTENSVKATNNDLESAVLATAGQSNGNDAISNALDDVETPKLTNDKDDVGNKEKESTLAALSCKPKPDNEKNGHGQEEENTLPERDHATKSTNEQAHTNIASSKENLASESVNDPSINTEASKSTETENSFKCPASIEYSRSNNNQHISNVGVDDVFYTDMEEITMKTDMQKNMSDNPITPLKQRQRVRPMPSLQRRNSLIGATNSTPSEDSSIPTDIVSQQQTKNTETDPLELTTPIPKKEPFIQRRERHYSASMVQSPLTSSYGTGQHHYTPHKFTPTMGLGRIRTESNCSAFSDSLVTATKIRKIDEQNNRSNQRKDFASRIVNGNLDKTSLKMIDLIYYNPTTNPMEKRPAITTLKKETFVDENDTKVKPHDCKEGITDTKTSNAMPVPQLKLNANGDLILDEKTLEIETTAEQEARKVLANSSLIFLDENTGMNGFYKRQKRSKDWPPEETVKFYRCLQTVGTDFSLMCQLFPKRTRRDLKLKFKKEERTNLALINKALLYPKLFNIDDLKEQLETEEREKEEAMQRWKEIQKKEAKTIKKVKINGSAAQRTLKHGEDVYENENVVKRKLKPRAKTSDKKKADSIKKAKITQQNVPTSPANDVYDTTELLPTKVPLKPKNNDMHVTTKHTTATTSHTMPIKPVKIELVQVFETAVKTEHGNYENILSDSQMSHNENVTPAEEDSYISSSGNYITNASNAELSHESNDYVPTKNHHEMFMKYDAASEADIKTYVNMDNGTVVNTFEYEDDNDDIDYEIMDTMPDTPASVSQREIDECDMEQILMDLAAGSLVLVSTLDPDNADQVVNEIYMMDKTTGELCDKPLDIPESIVQSVLSVMS